jgi:MFS family permease
MLVRFRLATSIAMLEAARFVLGLGMGGEWDTGAALVAESWPTEVRAKAISVVQSSWALGFAAAALVAGPVARYFGWRAVFFVGILPALLTLWIRRGVPESEMWEERESRGRRNSIDNSLGDGGRDPTSYTSLTGNVKFSVIFHAPYARHTFVLLLFNFCGMFAWWGLFTWLPPFLSLPVSQGGRGFGVMGTTTLLVVLNLFGMFPGYASFGWVADHLGRRKAFCLYSLTAAFLIPLYAAARSSVVLMMLGTAVAFFGTWLFSVLGSWAARFSQPACGLAGWIHLQRRVGDEFSRAASDWASGPDERSELGVLFVRSGISAGRIDDDTIARDARQKSGIAVASPGCGAFR